jgi:hypothetical protein
MRRERVDEAALNDTVQRREEMVHRSANVVTATALADAEQKQRVDEAALNDTVQRRDEMVHLRANVAMAIALANAEQSRRVDEHVQQQNLQIENNVALPLSPVVVATVSFSSRHLILVFHNVNSISTFSFLFIAIVIFSHQEESDYHHLAS